MVVWWGTHSQIIAAPAVVARRAIRIRSAAAVMSASLIGSLGSSAFRLSTAAVSKSLAGSCFRSESVPGLRLSGCCTAADYHYSVPA
jgi:hypothetical protein